MCLAALVAVVSAQYDSAYKHQPAAYKPATYATAYKPEYEQPAEYSFTYDVNDAQTYDVKSQSESLKDGYTVGQYSLIDADGLRRTVDYTADDYNGFQATVRREPVGHAYPSYSAPSYTAAPQYQAPAYNAPKYQAYNAPKYQAYKAAPKYQAPAYTASSYSAPSAYPSTTY
jgi:hypothetical protein